MYLMQREGQGWDEFLGQYHESTLRVVPALTDNQPAQEFLRWHGLQVFRTPGEISGAVGRMTE